jgi:hypothetical protein
MTREEAIKYWEEFLNEIPELLKKGFSKEEAKKQEEACKLAIEALGKMNEIIKILEDTDFHNAESLNEIGEDKGYCEAIRAISLEADRKYRWFYD